MSLSKLENLLSPTPANLRQQILGYARAVRDAAPDIFADAGVALNTELVDKLVLIAGFRKLHGICSANYWIIERSLTNLQSHGIYQVQIGGTIYTKDNSEYRQLRTLISELDAVLQNLQVNGAPLTPSTPYVDIVRELAIDGR